MSVLLVDTVEVYTSEPRHHRCSITKARNMTRSLPPPHFQRSVCTKFQMLLYQKKVATMTGSHQEQSVKLSKCCLTSGLTPAMFISLVSCDYLVQAYHRELHLSHFTNTCLPPATPVSLQLHLYHSSYTCLTPTT